MRPLLVIAAVAISLGAACREGDDSAMDTAFTTADSTSATALEPASEPAAKKNGRPGDTASAQPTPDGSVLGAFIAASQHEIQHGKLAEQKASTQAVRDLGRTVSRDHDDFVLNAQELGKRHGIKPSTASGDTSVSGHRGVMADLRAANGTEFDRVFLEHEIDYHRWLIDLINTTMLPRASNQEVKTFLQQAIPAFQQHSKAAQDLLAKQARQ